MIKKNRASLSISKETKGMLDLIKHTGQSYNGLIQELVLLWEKEHGLEESGQGYGSGMVMKLETKVFELSNGKYTNLPELAQAMGISVSQIYRVKQGERPVNQKFIIGAIKAFPGYKLDDLFYVAGDESHD